MRINGSFESERRGEVYDRNMEKFDLALAGQRFTS